MAPVLRHILQPPLTRKQSFGKLGIRKTGSTSRFLNIPIANYFGTLNLESPAQT